MDLDKLDKFFIVISIIGAAGFLFTIGFVLWLLYKLVMYFIGG